MSEELTDYDPETLEKEIREYWGKMNLPKTVESKYKGGKKRYMVQLPYDLKADVVTEPVFEKVIYDVMKRFHIMMGYHVKSMPGFNSFSLSVERDVFKEAGVEPGVELSKKNMRSFTEGCLKFSQRYAEKFSESMKDLAVMEEKDYVTYDRDYIDSAWWAVSQLNEKGLLVDGEVTLPWCGSCQATLGEDEIKEKTIRTDTYLVKLPVAKGKGRYLITELSRLWHILGTVALVVDPSMEYSVVAVKTPNGVERYLIRADKVDRIMDKLGDLQYKVTNDVPGDKLHGMEFENPIYEYIPNLHEIEEGFKVFTMDEPPMSYTGISAISPGYDTETDHAAEELGFSPFSPLSDDIRLKKDASLGDFSGIIIEKVENRLMDILVGQQLFLYEEKDSVTVDVCKHCDKEIVHKEEEEWFFLVSEIEEKVNRFFESTTCTPKWMGGKHHHDWNGEKVDWHITRREGWGIPFPRWDCECGNSFVAPSINELSRRSGVIIRDQDMIPSIMRLELNCESCGGTMVKSPKVLNSLFVASIAPWAQLGYPMELEGWNQWGPGDQVVSYIDHPYGNFYGLITLSAALFDDISVENFIGHGKVVLKGAKPTEVPDSFGSDPFRLEMLSDRPVWDDIEMSSDLFTTPPSLTKVLWNLFKFTEDKIRSRAFDPHEVTFEFLKDHLKIEDRWLLSEIESLKSESKEHYLNNRYDLVLSSLEYFILEDLAQFYIGLIRERLNGGEEKDRLVVLKILHEYILAVSKMLFPITPHICEKIYQEFDGSQRSIQLCEWPVVNRMLIDEQLSEDMYEVRGLIDMVYQAKRDYDMPEKWPLKRLIFNARDYKAKEMVDEFGHILKKKCRVEKIEIVPPMEEWDDMILKVHPNRNAIGKAYRQWVSRISLMLERRPAKEIKKGIDSGEYKLGIEGNLVEIQPQMVSFEREVPPGYMEIDHEVGPVYVDMSIDPKLWYRQTARDIILRLKSMRKELELQPEDETEVFITAAEDMIKSVERHEKELMDELNARELHLSPDEMEKAEYLLEWDINGEAVQMGLKPLYRTRLIKVYENIPGMSGDLAVSLYEEGYTTLEKLKQATARELSALDSIKRSLARRIVQVVKSEGDDFGKLPEEEVEEHADKEHFISVLQRVKGVGKARAEEIFEHGYKTPRRLLEAEVEELSRINHITVAHAKALKNEIRKEYRKKPSTTEVPKEEPEVEEEEEVEPEAEEEEEAPEIEMPEGIFRSSTYLMIEQKDEKSISIFKSILDAGMKGMLVTRQYPEKVKNKYSLDDVKMIWLSNVDRENTVRPKNLEKFSLTIEQFLAKEHGVILLNGMDYLITNNDFRTVLHLIQSLKDQVAINESILIIPVSPTTIEKNQMELLQREVDEILEDIPERF